METRNTYSLRSRLTLSYLLLTFILLLSVGGISGWKSKDAITSLTLNEVSTNARLKAERIQAIIGRFLGDLVAIAGTPPPAAMIRSIQNGGVDPKSKDDLETWRTRFSTILVSQAVKKDYQQLRFINAKGMELVRVDYKDKKGSITSDEMLQDKSDTDYFSKAMQLAKGEIYISRLELNRENGVVSEPYTPVLRFSTPVFDPSGKAGGVVVLNVYAKYFLETLSVGEAGSVTLSDEGGYYLYNPESPAKTFGFDRGHEERIESGIETKVDKESNTIIRDGRVISFQKIQIYHDKSKYWMVASSLDDVLKPVEELEAEIVVIAIFASLLVVFLSFWMARSITSPIAEAVLFAEQIAKGNFEINASTSSSSLETERLLQALRLMAKRIGKMVSTIRASEAQTKAIVDTAVDPIITINERGIVKSFNNAAASVFGYKAKEVIGNNVSLLMPEPDKSQHDDYLRHHLKTGQKKLIGMGREVVGRRKDGTFVSLHLSVSVISVGDSKSFCGILRDLTAEKANRDQLVQAGKLASLGTLATGIAHELRQPLQVMRGNADMEIFSGIEKLSPKTAFETLTEVVHMCDRMNSIIDHLCAFSRDGEGIAAESVDIKAVLDSSFTLLNQQFKSRGIDIDMEVEDNLPMIDGNPNRLEQVIINLLSNARDVLEGLKAPKVFIKVWSQGNHIVITLGDNGPGVPIELKSKIFDPFFTTKETGKGTGLGLSISHGIITEHHGTISISDRDEGGAEFAISLPVVVNE